MHHFIINEYKSPAEIKRREVRWTLIKKLDSFAGPLALI